MAPQPDWFSGTRWAHGTFMIKVDPLRPPDVEKTGWVGVDTPNWGIHFQQDVFVLTHLPTGYAAGFADLLETVSEVASRLEALPFNWQADTVEVIGCKETGNLSPEEREFYLETQAMVTPITELKAQTKKKGPPVRKQGR